MRSPHYVPEWKHAELLQQQQSEEVSPAAKEIAATTRAEFERRRNQLRKYIRYLDALIEGCADMPLLDVVVLRQQREKLQECADLITEQLQSRSFVYFGILQAAALAGTDLGYTSPPKGKPQGPGINYLIAAAARHGNQIGPDRACALIKQFNALPWIRARFGGEGNLSVDIDVIESPFSLWNRMWDEYVDWLRVNRRPNLSLP